MWFDEATTTKQKKCEINLFENDWTINTNLVSRAFLPALYIFQFGLIIRAGVFFFIFIFFNSLSFHCFCFCVFISLSLSVWHSKLCSREKEATGLSVQRTVEMAKKRELSCNIHYQPLPHHNCSRAAAAALTTNRKLLKINHMIFHPTKRPLQLSNSFRSQTKSS